MVAADVAAVVAEIVMGSKVELGFAQPLIVVALRATKSAFPVEAIPVATEVVPGPSATGCAEAQSVEGS